MILEEVIVPNPLEFIEITTIIRVSFIRGLINFVY